MSGTEQATSPVWRWLYSPSHWKSWEFACTAELQCAHAPACLLQEVVFLSVITLQQLQGQATSLGVRSLACMLSWV